jgi:hypothetical protein
VDIGKSTQAARDSCRPSKKGTENKIELLKTKDRTYSGCQKNVPLKERFFLQSLIPTFGISELIFEKRYNEIFTCLFPDSCLVRAQSRVKD